MSENIVGRRMRIVRAMKTPPMNQQELLAKLQAEGMDVSQSTLSKIENGSRYVTDIELKIIAKVLNVSVLSSNGCAAQCRKVRPAGGVRLLLR